MTSSQESRDPSSLGYCCFSSRKEFSSTKKQKTNGSRPSNAVVKQAKEKHKASRYSRSDVIRHQSIITRSTSLGVAKAGNLKLDFMAKSIEIHFFEFEDMFRCLRDNENLKKHFGHMYTLSMRLSLPNVKQNFGTFLP